LVGSMRRALFSVVQNFRTTNSRSSKDALLQIPFG
jgi:hypothetical protein